MFAIHATYKTGKRTIFILLSNRFANVTNASSGSTCRYGTDSYLVGVIKLTAANDDLAAVTLFVWLNLTENRQSQAADDYASTCTCTDVRVHAFQNRMLTSVYKSA